MSDINLNILGIDIKKKTAIYENLKKIQKPQPLLSFLEQNILLCVFGDSCYKLDILQRLLPCSELIWDMEYIDLASRFKLSKRIILPEAIPSEEEAQLTIIQQCRFFLKSLFYHVINDVSLLNSYEIIIEFITREYNTALDNAVVGIDHKHFKQAISRLNKEIEDLKTKTEEELLYLTENKSRDQAQAKINAWVEQQVAESYVQHRETVRVNQVKLKNEENEDDIKNNMADISITNSMENRVNREIETFLLLSQAELQEKLDEWTLKYNTEIEHRDVELLQLKNRQEEQKENMKKTLELFTERHEEMQSLREITDEREREQKEKIRENKTAMIIQTWWRNFWFMYKIRMLVKKKQQKKKK